MARRLAAILAADVVGYSKLMAEDEEGTLAALKAHRREVFDPETAKRGGRIVKLMGDGVLVEFPSVVDAVECARAIQTALAGRGNKIKLRIGINLGDIIIDGDDIYGDGVNVAARLEALAEPGGICISGKVHDEVRGKLGFEAENMGEVQLKNITQPVRAYHLWPASTQVGVVSSNKNPTDSGRTSIAVLPFVNMSGNAEQDYFADGISEDLITELSRYRHVSVTARNTTFLYKGRSVNVTEVGRELGVDFVVEGSVRQAGNRVRITAQLIDVETGAHVWAEKFDRAMENIFAVQDDVVAEIIAHFTFGLDEAAGARRHRNPTTNSTAYTHFLQARAAWREGEEKGARELLLRAIDLDPQFARALSYLAYFYSYGRFSQTTGLSDEEAARLALNFAERAIAADRGDPFTLHRIAITYNLLGETAKAQPLIEAAAAQNPHDLDVIVVHGLILAYCGRHQEGLDLLERAGRIESRMTPGYRWAMSDAYYLAHDYTKSYAAISPIIDPPPFMRVCQAASLAQLGRGEEACRIVKEVSTLIDTARIVRMHVAMCVLPEDAEHWLDGFRKAGINV